MCLIVFAWQSHPEYPFVLAGNRDEFYARPTEAAHWWPDSPGVLAGRDQKAGGTWCGIASSGRFAALTNFRGPSEGNALAPSRGALVSDYLAGRHSAANYLAGLATSKARYNGFNLLLAEGLQSPASADLWVDSNRDATMPRRLEGGIHGVSNAQLDTPWPKVETAKARLQNLLAGDALAADALIAALLALLTDPQIAPDETLPATGVPLAAERSLSAAFIRMPGYGTRTSTVILVDHRGRLCFHESTHPVDQPYSMRRFSSWAAPG